MSYLKLTLLALVDWKLYEFEGTIKHLIEDVRDKLRQPVAIFREGRNKDVVYTYLKYRNSPVDIESVENIADGIVDLLLDRITIDLKDVRIHVCNDNTVWIERKGNFDIANEIAYKILNAKRQH